MARREALTREGAEETVPLHESLSLSERDRTVFFDALMRPPEPNARLRRAFRMAAEQVASR